VTGWGTLEPDAEVGVMKQVDAHRAVLATLKDWLPYLAANSGLPGPRGNLELVAACGEEADLERVEELLATDDEFAVVCAMVALGRHLACGDTTHLETLHGYASDARWRVREGVAMALQRAADDAPELAFRSAEQWARDDDPLVRRAAVAAVCEPRLLRERTHALRALAILSSITADLAQLPAERRRDASIRTLRQALGYGWSVVVAADPDDALPVFLRLQDDPDPDVAWIVRENGKKARLQRVLAERRSPPITPCGS
jgi:hypothetical protein